MKSCSGEWDVTKYGLRATSFQQEDLPVRVFGETVGYDSTC